MTEPTAVGARLVGHVTHMVVALFLVAGSADAQQPVVQLEADFYPKSSVARSLTGPVTEAEVVGVRGQLILPLLIRGERTLFVPGLSGS